MLLLLYQTGHNKYDNVQYIFIYAHNNIYSYPNTSVMANKIIIRLSNHHTTPKMIIKLNDRRHRRRE